MNDDTLPWESGEALEPEEIEARNPPFPAISGAQVYSYFWANGLPAMKVVRVDAVNGHQKKSFAQWTIDNGAWVARNHIPAGQRPLYRLDALLEMPDAKVLVVEGEKTALAAVARVPSGWVVVSWSGGSSAVAATDWTPLKGRTVTIWPDNDEPGRKAAKAIAERVAGAKIVDVPLEFPEKWDLADEPPAGWAWERVWKCLGVTIGEPDALKVPEIPGTVAHLLWDDNNIPVRRWIVEGIIPTRTVTLLQGDGGLGKSLVTLQLAHACATGREWLGQPTRPCKVLAVYCEDDPDELQRRLHDINRHFAEDPSDELPGHKFADLTNLKLVSRIGMESLLMLFDGSDIGSGKVTELLTMIENEAAAFGAELVILDSLHDLYGGNENNRVQVRQFVNGIQRIALNQNGAVLLNGHPSKSGLLTDGSSGSTAWNNSVRSRLYLSRAVVDGEATGPLGIDIKKSNYAACGERIEIEWRDGFFTPINRPNPNASPVYKKAHCETTFLDLLRTTMKQGRYVTDSKNAGNYAPKVFAAAKGAHGFSRAEFTAAMERLFQDHRIKKAGVKNAARNLVSAIVEVEKSDIPGPFGDL